MAWHGMAWVALSSGLSYYFALHEAFQRPRGHIILISSSEAFIRYTDLRSTPSMRPPLFETGHVHPSQMLDLVTLLCWVVSVAYVYVSTKPRIARRIIIPQKLPSPPPPSLRKHSFPTIPKCLHGPQGFRAITHANSRLGGSGKDHVHFPHHTHGFNTIFGDGLVWSIDMQKCIIHNAFPIHTFQQSLKRVGGQLFPVPRDDTLCHFFPLSYIVLENGKAAFRVKIFHFTISSMRGFFFCHFI